MNTGIPILVFRILWSIQAFTDKSCSPGAQQELECPSVGGHMYAYWSMRCQYFGKVAGLVLDLSQYVKLQQPKQYSHGKAFLRLPVPAQNMAVLACWCLHSKRAKNLHKQENTYAAPFIWQNVGLQLLLCCYSIKWQKSGAMRWNCSFHICFSAFPKQQWVTTFTS